MSTLLIVEDETPIRRIISMHLSLVGHAVLGIHFENTKAMNY